jgi:DNA helicase II / ATP-dependent DNA helicase PcrA
MTPLTATTTITPTAEQTAIQRAPERNIIIQANAGAAKTTTLALKVAHALAQQLDPERILVLTYTAPACQAMRQALAKVGVDTATIKRLPIQTFEQFCAQMLLGIEGCKVPLKTTPEQLAPIIFEAIEELNLGLHGSRLAEHFLTLSTQLKGTLARDLLLWDDQKITPEICDDLGFDVELMRLFGAYENIRYPQGDHCDKALFRGPFDATYDLARMLANPQTSTPIAEMAAWPHHIHHLLIDEMHDLNLAAFTVLKALLRSTNACFCGVGDLDQVVFSLAGANACYMEKNVDLGPLRQVVTYPLTASRRFGASLAVLAKRLADKPYAHDCAHKTQVLIQTYDTLTQCAHKVAAQASLWKTSHPRDMSGLAVLLRHPYQSVHIENALLQAKLPYQSVGFQSYLLQPEVLLVRALLALHAQGFGAFTSSTTRKELVLALVFFCNVQLEYAHGESETSSQRLAMAVDAIAMDASMLSVFFQEQVLRRGEPRLVQRLKNAIQACQNSGPDLLKGVLQALEMESWAREVFVEKQRCLDAQAYMKGLLDAAQAFTTAHAFFDHLNQAEAQITDTPSARINKQKNTVLKKKNLILSTVAQAKGLEFDHVILPCLAQGQFPAKLARTASEERNLFYVAMTRAKQNLTLLVDSAQPSEFIEKMGLSRH